MTNQRGRLLALAAALLLYVCCIICCTPTRAATPEVATNQERKQHNTTASQLDATNMSTNTTNSAQPTTLPAAAETTTTAAAAAITTTTATTTTTSTDTPTGRATVREPTEQEINEARKIIQEVASSMKETNPHRLVMNKPSASSPLHDYPPDSPEARISEATSRFGLSLMRASASLAGAADGNQTGASKPDNTIISPISLQMLMNLVLLGTRDQSACQLELARVLGYEHIPSMALARQTGANSSSELEDGARVLRPHEAMRRLVESIMRATHLSVEERHLQRLLLNSNPASSEPGSEQLEAHLQTSLRDNDTPLGGQLNFTLANLMLTNRRLLRTSPDYERQLRHYYQTKVEQFSRGAEGAGAAQSGAERPLHERLNEWVRNVTQGQISDLVGRETLDDPLLLLVLINAAHFKGHWLHTFNTRLTEERTFYNFGREPKDAKFMRQNGQFAYAEFRAASQTAAGASRRRRAASAEDEPETSVIDYASEQAAGERAARRVAALNVSFSALALPFSLNDGKEMSMVVLLPSKRDGLDELVHKLDVAALSEIYGALAADTQSVQVELPIFTMEAAHDVRRLLETMGVRRIFHESSAELDHMFGRPQPAAFVSKVIHKAKIAVDEKGAEAAAASLATVNMRSSIHISLPTFTADHPFLYIIRHSRSNMPLFMGQLRRV